MLFNFEKKLYVVEFKMKLTELKKRTCVNGKISQKDNHLI